MADYAAYVTRPITGKMRHEGHRISRHYYDVYKLINSEVSKRVLFDKALGNDCVRHAKLFFNSANLDLDSACKGAFSLVPDKKMLKFLEKDYKAMRGMIFGEQPDFFEVIKNIELFSEKLLNC